MIFVDIFKQDLNQMPVYKTFYENINLQIDLRRNPKEHLTPSSTFKVKTISFLKTHFYCSATMIGHNKKKNHTHTQ